jgi:hypothetical protein
VTTFEENQKLRKKSELEDLSDAINAIVLTSMATEAEYVERDLDKYGDNMLIGQDLVKYFRKDWCIYLTKTMLLEITSAIK